MEEVAADPCQATDGEAPTAVSPQLPALCKAQTQDYQPERYSSALKLTEHKSQNTLPLHVLINGGLCSVQKCRLYDMITITNTVCV